MNSNTAHMVIFKDSKKHILLIKRRDNSLWVMPGGHVEKRETFERAVIREVAEETGLKVSISNLAVKLKSPQKNIEKRVYIGKVLSGKARISSESSEIKWWGVTKLPRSMTLYEKMRIRLAIEYKGITLIRLYKIYPLLEMFNLLTQPKLLLNALVVEMRRK